MTRVINPPCDVLLYYHLHGNNNNSNPANYRPDNPWKKLNDLRDDLGSGGLTALACGVDRLYSPDDSVWRIMVKEGEPPPDVAKKLLDWINSLFTAHSKDLILAVACPQKGTMIEQMA